VHRSGVTYDVIDDREPVDAPAWLLEWPGLRAAVRVFGEAGSNAPRAIDEEHPEWIRRVNLAREYLEKAPPSVVGDNGSGKLWAAALYLVRRLELPLETCAELIEHDYNPRCEPTWSEAEIWHKLESARDKSDLPCGLAPEGWKLSAPTPAALVKGLAARAEEGHDAPPTEEIEITADLHANVSAACRAIGADPDLYQRDGELVRVVRVTESDADRRNLAGTPTVRRMNAATLKARLTKVIAWKRLRLEKTMNADGSSGTAWKSVATKPDEDIVSAVLHEGRTLSTRPACSASTTSPLHSGARRSTRS
jgi:hypothetical protein